MRHIQWFGVAVVFAVAAGGLACDDKETPSTATAPSASARPSASASAAAAPSASAAPSTAAADAATDAPSAKALAEEDEALSMEVETEHRHHHGGFAGIVMMAVDTLGTSAEQATALDKIRADFDKKMKPIHEANAEVGTLLAAGIAAGTIDKAKVDAAVVKAKAAAANAHAAVDEELTALHGALRAEQRAALVDKVDAEWTMWKEANALDQVAENAKPNGHLKHFAKKFGLTDDQVTKARAAIDASKEAREHFDTAAEDAHLKAFSAAFTAEKFDAKKLPEPAAENSRLVAWGAKRTARFYEALAPILTPEQRTKVADELREHANEHQAERKP